MGDVSRERTECLPPVREPLRAVDGGSLPGQLGCSPRGPDGQGGVVKAEEGAEESGEGSKMPGRTRRIVSSPFPHLSQVFGGL